MNQQHTFLISPADLKLADLGVTNSGQLQPGMQLELPDAEARHAQVRRITPGEQVAVCDGAGYRILSRCVLAPTPGGPRAFTVEVEEVVFEPQPALPLRLVQALAKNDRDEQAIEAATELGVMEVIPWQAERCVVQWRGKKSQKGRDRWAQIVRAATKQSRRAWVPQVGDVVANQGLTEKVAQWVDQGEQVLVLDGKGANLPPIGSHAACTVIVGPEGGITDHEIAALTAAGAHHVRLGSHTMRASSAGPAALAVLNWRTGIYGEATNA